MTTLPSVEPQDRRSVLTQLRAKLLAELETTHRAACSCECGPAADGRVVATLSKELRAVVAELDALPDGAEVSTSGALRDEVAAKRASRLAQASGL